MPLEPLSNVIAVNNMETLAGCEIGDKVLVDKATGTLKIEDRMVLVGLRRYMGGAFYPEIIQRTFENAVRIIEEETTNPGSNPDSMYASGGIVPLRLFPDALGGLKRLQTTYANENNNQVETELGSLFNEYSGKYEELSKPVLSNIIEGDISPSEVKYSKKKTNVHEFTGLLEEENSDSFEDVALEISQEEIQVAPVEENKIQHTLSQCSKKIANVTRHLCGCCWGHRQNTE